MRKTTELQKPELIMQGAWAEERRPIHAKQSKGSFVNTTTTPSSSATVPALYNSSCKQILSVGLLGLLPLTSK
jgi:hypothetical protein